MQVHNADFEDLPASAPEVPAETIDIAAMIADLWARKWLLPLFMFLTLAAGALYLNLATYRYTAKVQVTAADSGGSSIPSGLAGIGSIVGVDIGLDSGSSFSLFPEAARSEAVARIVAGNEALMRGLFPAHWDSQKGVWREPPSPIRSVTKPVKGLLGIPDVPWQKPGSAELRDLLQTKLIISEDRKKGITSLSFEHRDPKLAAQLLTAVVHDADEFLRAKALTRADEYVAYLERRLQETQVVEYRMSLAKALSGYENMRMMASAHAPYAAEPFGSVTVSHRPTTPQPVMVLGIALLSGVVLWGAWVLVALPLVQRLR